MDVSISARHVNVTPRLEEVIREKIGTLDRPEPGEGEVLVRIKAAGVNPVDAAVARGMLSDNIPAKFPAIPGWDLAGVVEERGHAARRFDEGDEVYAYARRPTVQHGTFAEYTVLPECYLASRPQQISMEEAGGIPLVGLTAYQALFQFGDLQEDQTLLILGSSGGVGTMAIQLAKSAGATVIGVASASNHDYMTNLGADETIDYKVGNVGVSVREAAPDGVDFIFHCSRGDSLEQSIDTIKSGGQLISITNTQPDVPDDVNFHYVSVEPNASQLEDIRELADEEKINIPISKTFSLDEVGEALQQIESLHSQGKTVITP